MQITNNSPSAGFVAWTGITVKYRDVSYTITDGNSNKKFLWWDFTSPTVLQETDTMPTLEDTDAIIIYNDNGTYHLMIDTDIHGEYLVDGTVSAAKLEETYVETTGNETIGGVKTFDDFPVLPSDNPVADREAAHKKYVDDNIGAIGASDVAIAEIVPATYDDVQDWLNNTQSAGYVSGGAITDAGSGKINISAVKGFIKTTDSELGLTQSFDLAASSNFELTDLQTNYIYVDYNGGTPIFGKTTTRSNIELNRHFTLGRVYRSGTTLHIAQGGVQLPNFLREEHERLLDVRGFERGSGGVITETGNRYLVSTAGVFYLGNNKITTTGKNTSGADTFTRHYHSGGNWTSDTKSQICAAAYQYDDGTDLANLTGSRYGVFWIFIHFDGDLQVVVGRGNYTLAQAQAANVPTTPNVVSDFSTLAAKIIIKRNATNFASVETSYETFFPTGGPFEHNDLGAIQGGAADDYYHLSLTGINTFQNDFVIYKAINDGNPQFRIGSADANEAHIQAVYDSGAQMLDYLLISTDSGGEGDIALMPNGNVGIGTTTPDRKLDMLDASNPQLRLTQDFNTYIDLQGDSEGKFILTSSDNAFFRALSGTDTQVSIFQARTSDGDESSFMAYGRSAAGTKFGQNRAGLSVIEAKPVTFFGIGTGTNTPMFFATNSIEALRIDTNRRIGINVVTPLAQLHIDQSVSDAAIPVLSLDQADLSEGFINFIGTSAGSAVGPISSWTAGNAINGFVRVEINGVQRWIAYYDDPTS